MVGGLLNSLTLLHSLNKGLQKNYPAELGGVGRTIGESPVPIGSYINLFFTLEATYIVPLGINRLLSVDSRLVQ